ncbi:MAG: FeoB-associated Cys-rich membrane protein [Muribaculaceae bacterium]|nr:FeoB-associated Cys-rich membrane protein [Bacteroidales bacterium]MDD6723730.1 FeoB-associated Cys-rich membrane protein [Bacteroidales bacterium]
MSDTVQLIIVGLVVAAAVAIAIRSLILVIRGKRSGCPSCSEAANCPLSRSHPKTCPTPKTGK